MEEVLVRGEDEDADTYTVKSINKLVQLIPTLINTVTGWTLNQHKDLRQNISQYVEETCGYVSNIIPSCKDDIEYIKDSLLSDLD